MNGKYNVKLLDSTGKQILEYTNVDDYDWSDDRLVILELSTEKKVRILVGNEMALIIADK